MCNGGPLLPDPLVSRQAVLTTFLRTVVPKRRWPPRLTAANGVGARAAWPMALDKRTKKDPPHEGGGSLI